MTTTERESGFRRFGIPAEFKKAGGQIWLSEKNLFMFESMAGYDEESLINIIKKANSIKEIIESIANEAVVE